MTRSSRIQLLDCTIRDGFLGLEDAYINGIANFQINKEERAQLGELITSTRADIVEIGSIEISEKDKRGFCIYQNIEQASSAAPAKKTPDQMIVGLFRGPDTPLKDIPVRDESLLEGLRVIIRYSEMKKSLDFCAHLAQKGYKVFIQPMATMRYSDEELDLVIEYANKINAYALYFVDSYGYMMPDDVIGFTEKFDSALNRGIRIGFHSHNNMNMAFANAIAFLNYKTDRNVIVDATASGMGQGAGNLQTEIITDYLNRHYEKNYNFEAVLSACDFVEMFNQDNLWGYSVMRMIPAAHRAAYKYAVALRKTYLLSYVEINRLMNILDTLPGEMRHRYTKENVRKLMELGNVKAGQES